MEKYQRPQCAVIGLSFILVCMSCSDEDTSRDATSAGGSSRTRSEPEEASSDDSSASAPVTPPTASGSPNDSTTAESPSDPTTPLKDLPAKCKGFEVIGLEYSPGGETLPNTCAPFDGLRNNPYAIRCIDADPNYQTQYAGDEFCILPPPPELGTQVRVGPEDYDDPGMFELAPGAEETRSYFIDANTDVDHYFYRTNARMRHGGHHVGISASDTDIEDGWGGESPFPVAAPSRSGDQVPSGLSANQADLMSGNFGVVQRVNHDRPQGILNVPPEDSGLGGMLKTKQQMSFNLHYINTSEEPIIREVWLNVWYMDEKNVTTKLRGFNLTGNPAEVAIPAQQRTVLTYQCDVAEDMRILSLYGHRHAHTDRFGIWIEKASGETFTAYESFDWEDMPAYQYDSISVNPKPNLEMKIDGASTGLIHLTKGDRLYFLCDINNTLDVPLRFANETITGEMCIVFGAYTGPASPCVGGATRVKD